MTLGGGSQAKNVTSQPPLLLLYCPARVEVKLYNKTPYPSEPLRALLEVAGRAAGARTAGVVVKITLARGTQVRGFAQRSTFLYGWHLWRGGGQRVVMTDGGYIQLQLPHPTRMQARGSYVHCACKSLPATGR